MHTKTLHSLNPMILTRAAGFSPRRRSRRLNPALCYQVSADKSAIRNPQSAIPNTGFSVAMVDADAIGPRPATSVMDLPLDPVDGGEIIKFAVKPSMWSPVIDSFGWLLASVVLAIVCITAEVGMTGASPQTTAQIILGVGAARLGLAVIRWVSCWYVLTNRRVVEIRGIRSPRVTSAMLLDVRNTYVTSALHEKTLRLGTITFVSNRDGDRPWHWKHVAEPEEIHLRVRRAIENAIDSLQR